jgi:hypothetical protein
VSKDRLAALERKLSIEMGGDPHVASIRFTELPTDSSRWHAWTDLP